uniref:Retinoic acid receptor rxr beta a n=1 Tax=Echinococcus granulosus TaxID=6210 RepID=A0A068WN10_ECHGR|nr:retinoic acid receptor rxr beta a [Echinococcus granulosus]
MQVWSNSNNASSVAPPANGDRDPMHSMPVTAESVPPTLNAFDSSIFASLISESDEKPLVDLKSDVISNADLQIGSAMPKPDLGSLYGGLQSSTQTNNTCDVATTHRTVFPANPQLQTLPCQSSCVSGSLNYPYTPTLYSPVTPVSPQYFQSAPPTVANHRALPHQQQGSYSLPPLRSYSYNQSFITGAYPKPYNYTIGSDGSISPYHRSVPSTSVKKVTYLCSARNCAICGATATGKHYGALSCDSCRAFFGTATHLGLRCECSGKSNIHDNNHQLRCHSCRLRKCLAVGMRKEAVRFEKSHAMLLYPNEKDYSSVAPSPASSICSHERADNLVGSRSSPATEATVKQIRAAEALIFDVPPLDLPESKPIFMDGKDCDSLQTDIQESIINLLLWSQKIPLFSDFSDSDRFILLRAGCIELLLVHFISRLANSLTESHSSTSLRSSNPPLQESSPSTSVTPIESTTTPPTPLNIPVVVVDVLFPFHSAPKDILFSQQAECDLRNADRWHESRVLMNILPVDVDHHPISITDVPNELNAQCLSRRLILCRLFDLARLFKRLCLSVEAVGCLRMVILFNPDVPELTEATRERVESRRDEAFICLEHTFVKADKKTALGRMAQMCLHLADLSFVAERIYSKTSSHPYPSFQCLVDLLECFYKSDPMATVSESST